MRAALLALLLTGGASAETITEAHDEEPTDAYAHGVLGDTRTYRVLIVSTDSRGSDGPATDAVVRTTTYRIRLELDHVFEDIAPRLADVDGNGEPEVLVVETQLERGAQLAVYDETGKVAATPFIGTRHRWLAPAGVGDFDGDGRPEIAYVDRPHLARELVFVRRNGDRLVEVARAPGFSNHRIGEDAILSAVRDCGAAELLLPDLDRTRLLAVRLDGGGVTMRDAGPWTGPASLARGAAC
jgi:hypothetical protein